MAAVDIHPNIADLEAFTLGTLDDASMAGVEAHLANCPTCQKNADTTSDTFVELLRRVHNHETAARSQFQTPAPTNAETVLLAPPVAADANDTEICENIPPELVRHDRYRMRRLIGAGGMGAVYEAEHCVMKRPVAIKVINRAFTTNPVAVERFRREVVTAARLSHPNIVNTLDAEDAAGSLFLVMEYVEGVSLSALVKKRGPLPVSQACDSIRQAALGLQHAHERGMVHRDIKPDNLIRCANGSVKVLDFGLAVLTTERGNDSLTGPNVVMGTPDYLAPEQAEDARTADARSDVYSLGCTLYYLLTGVVPYPASTALFKILAHREQPVPSLRSARPGVPNGLAPVVARMLAKKPADRYQTAGAVAAALAPFIQPFQDDESARMVGEHPCLPRRRSLVASLGGFFVCAAALAGLAVYQIKTTNGEIVLQTEDHDLEVIITRGGALVRIHDPRSKQRWELDTAKFQIGMADQPEGLRIELPGKEPFVLKRGEADILRVSRVQKSPKPAPTEPKLSFLTKPVTQAVFTPDGQQIIVSSWDGTVVVYDAATTREVRRFIPQTRGGYSLALSPDGKRLAIGSSVSDVVLMDPLTGEPQKVLRGGHTAAVVRLAFSPKGDRLATGSWDRTACVWDVASGKLLHKLEGTADEIYGLAFHPDGERVLTAGRAEGTIRVWEAKTGKLLFSLVAEKPSHIRQLAISPDGKLVGAAEEGNGVRLWDLDRKKESRFVGKGTKGCMSVAFSPDGTKVAIGGWSGSVWMRDLSSDRLLWSNREYPEMHVLSLAFNRDGSRLVKGEAQPDARIDYSVGAASIWNVAIGKKVQPQNAPIEKLKK